MRLGERWIWVGEPVDHAAAGIVIYADFPGQWWLARGAEMAGPFGDREVLRALRIACTPVIDGCEKVDGKSGFVELDGRRPHKRRPRHYQRSEQELPASITPYDRAGLEPVAGCCTTFDALPDVRWSAESLWPHDDERPAHVGVLRAPWNAHPASSLVGCTDPRTFDGLQIVDVPKP